jgi:23S rRNA (cytosine1962-C5)-methyltransferase
MRHSRCYAGPVPEVVLPEIVIKAGHVQPVWAGHPWVYAQGVERTLGAPSAGDEVVVLDAKGNRLGRGLYSPQSAIVVRLHSRNADEAFDESLLLARLRRAELARTRLLAAEGGEKTSAYRLVYGEGDELPGLIVDRFEDVLVVQLGTIGLFRRTELIVAALQQVFRPKSILNRTSERQAQSEGFTLGPAVAFGDTPTELGVVERGLSLSLPLSLTQKTGFYFDQRPLRARIEHWAEGRDVLDAYSYVGAVGLFAKRGGAKTVLAVDSSRAAVLTGKKAAAELALDVSFEEADAEKFLAARPRSFDLVVADPPKFAFSRSMQQKAMRAFRRVSGLAVGAVREGGIVALSSCSAALGMGEVERCLALGAADVGRRARIFERVYQGGDHPVPAAFPEGLYLSSVLAWVD